MLLNRVTAEIIFEVVEVRRDRFRVAGIAKITLLLFCSQFPLIGILQFRNLKDGKFDLIFDLLCRPNAIMTTLFRHSPVSNCVASNVRCEGDEKDMKSIDYLIVCSIICEFIFFKEPQDQIQREATSMTHFVPFEDRNGIQIKDLLTAKNVVISEVSKINWKLVCPFVECIHKHRKYEKRKQVASAIHG